MKPARNSTVLFITVLVCLFGANADAIEGVSPGAVDRMAQVNNACPTFNWEVSDGAALYELVAYRLPEEAQTLELSPENEIFFAQVSGSATGWTPSADQCFAPGGRYVWFVRSVTEMIDDQVIEAGEWSAGRYFTVPATPSAEEMKRALDVLRRWETASGGGSLMLSSAAVPAAVPAPATGADLGSSHRKSVPTAAAAIRGEHPDMSGEVYGVVGTSASEDGAGVAASNMAGGPDLVLDGLTHGETDTALSEAGIDRRSVNSEVFEVKNSGSGGMRLSVEGEIEATALDCPNCVDSATIADGSIIDNDLADDSVTTAKLTYRGVTTDKINTGAVTTIKLAQNSVDSSKIGAGAVTAAEIRTNAVTSDAIADGGVMTVDLANGAVTRSKIGLGQVTATEISDNAVVSGKILDGTIGSADLAASAVTATEIADNAVVSGKILDGTIGSADLADSAVTTAKLTYRGVTTDKINTGAVTTIKLGASAVTTDKIADGTVAGFDIAANAISTVHLTDWAVETNKLDTDAVTSIKIANGAVQTSDVLNGTLKAEDVDPAGGVYASKLAVYSVPETNSIQGGSCVTIISECADANDLGLQGFCRTAPNTSMFVRYSEAVNWETESDRASWTCDFCYPDGVGTEPITGTILCISVPGP